MFAYCRNNPVSRVDVSGLYDLECEDVDPIEDELVHEDSGLGGGGQSASSGNITSGQSYSGSPGEGSTTIYRYGYAETGPKKLVPTNQDLKNADNSGLSFSAKPRPGSAMTTIDAVNSTGVLYAVQDGTYHVSVYPIGGTLADWYAAGYTSKWTEALVDIVQISPEMEISQK